MVDYFALGIAHALLALAAWRMILRDDLDRDPDPQSDDAAAPAAPAAKGPGRA